MYILKLEKTIKIIISKTYLLIINILKNSGKKCLLLPCCVHHIPFCTLRARKEGGVEVASQT